MAAILAEEKSAWLMTHWYVKLYGSWLILTLPLLLVVKINNKKVIYGRMNWLRFSQLMAAILLEEKSAWLMTHWYDKTHVSWLIFPFSLQLVVIGNNQKVIYGRTNVHSFSQSDGSHFTSSQCDPWLTHMSKFIFRDSNLYCDSDSHCLYIDRESYIQFVTDIYTSSWQTQLDSWLIHTWHD